MENYKSSAKLKTLKSLEPSQLEVVLEENEDNRLTPFHSSSYWLSRQESSPNRKKEDVSMKLSSKTMAD